MCGTYRTLDNEREEEDSIVERRADPTEMILREAPLPTLTESVPSYGKTEDREFRSLEMCAVAPESRYQSAG